MRDKDLPTPRLVATIAVFVVLGTPPVFLVWRFVNQLLLGEFDGSVAALAALGLVVLAALMALVAHSIRGWEEA